VVCAYDYTDGIRILTDIPKATLRYAKNIHKQAVEECSGKIPDNDRRRGVSTTPDNTGVAGWRVIEGGQKHAFGADETSTHAPASHPEGPRLYFDDNLYAGVILSEAESRRLSDQ